MFDPGESLERPELFDRLTPFRVKETEEANLELDRRVVPEQELLRNRLRFNYGHYNCSVNRSSNARKSSAPSDECAERIGNCHEPHGRVWPGPIKENLLIGDDERRHRAQQESATAAVPGPDSAHRRWASSRTARRAHLEQVANVTKESSRCREDQCDANCEYHLKREKHGKQNHRRGWRHRDTRASWRAGTPRRSEVLREVEQDGADGKNGPGKEDALQQP